MHEMLMSLGEIVASLCYPYILNYKLLDAMVVYSLPNIFLSLLSVNLFF